MQCVTPNPTYIWCTADAADALYKTYIFTISLADMPRCGENFIAKSRLEPDLEERYTEILPKKVGYFRCLGQLREALTGS